MAAVQQLLTEKVTQHKTTMNRTGNKGCRALQGNPFRVCRGLEQKGAVVILSEPLGLKYKSVQLKIQ